MPGASEVECGNYRDMDLPAAKAEAAAMLPVLDCLLYTSHICEGFGWLSNEDQTATCLPARAVLTIVPVS